MHLRLRLNAQFRHRSLCRWKLPQIPAAGDGKGLDDDNQVHVLSAKICGQVSRFSPTSSRDVYRMIFEVEKSHK